MRQNHGQLATVDHARRSRQWRALGVARRQLGLLVLTLGLLWLARPASGQPSFEREPINYSTAPVRDPVSRLQQQLDAGQVTLSYEQRHGYLKSVLAALRISPTSQMLVFSKTSFQLQRITPRTPRAIYFGDEVYVGWVPGGEVMEVSAVDPLQGVIFYTLAQDGGKKPRFVRDRGDCLSCHASSRTQDVPGSLVRSVFTAPSGQPHFGAGTFRTNHASPLKERWGGWYVTGTHGAQRHMGNVLARDKDHPEQLDVEAGANLTDLRSRFDTAAYLTPHSDIVALLVLEHQTDMHNLLTRANYDARLALRDAAIMNQMLGQPVDTPSPSAQRRIENAGERLVKYLLFAEETKLTDPIQGTAQFAQHFMALGPRDRQGRSLRDLDLHRRLCKYPCSYLIYSPAFAALPAPAKDFVLRRLHEILTGADKTRSYDHLSAADREAILTILCDTKPDLPDYWRPTRS